MALYKCVDKRPPSKSPVAKAAPRSREERFARLEKHGKKAFLLPSGTPSSPGVPSYPVVNRRGCFHCGMARAAYTRMGQALSRPGPEAYKRRIRVRRRDLIDYARRFADEDEPSNACNWAFAAFRRYIRSGIGR